jgi:hypothetical protein
VRAIDRLLPEFDVHEVHAVELPVPAERGLAAALATPVAPDAIVRTLFRLRGLSGRGTIEELFPRMGFEELARTPTEVVVGATGAPWRPRPGIGPFVRDEPGTVRMATTFVAEALPHGARLTTETRVAALDAAARRSFRRYWRVVGPFSALIRRRWLAAVSRAVGGEPER